MGRNKRLQYTLLALVLLIWGTIAWQFMGFKNSNDPSLSSGSTPLLSAVQNNRKPDTFRVQFDYQDPFLKKGFKVGSKIRSSAKASRNNNHSPAELTAESSFPGIVYKGYSMNGNNIERIILNIDGVTRTMKKGDKEGALELLKVEKDQITVKIGTHTKTIARESSS